MVDAERVGGKCFVLHTELIDDPHYQQFDDCFFLDTVSDAIPPKLLHSIGGLDPLGSSRWRSCSACLQDHLHKANAQRQDNPNAPRLKALELFCGTGGLSNGLEGTGCIDTVAAVEYSPSAAKAYSKNHPNTQVFTQCAHALLDHTVSSMERPNQKPLLSLGDSKPLPPLCPDRDIDLIYGGPPWWALFNTLYPVVDISFSAKASP